jgi:hypothetical protein
MRTFARTLVNLHSIGVARQACDQRLAFAPVDGKGSHIALDDIEEHDVVLLSNRSARRMFIKPFPALDSKFSCIHHGLEQRRGLRRDLAGSLPCVVVLDVQRNI